MINLQEARGREQDGLPETGCQFGFIICPPLLSLSLYFLPNAYPDHSGHTPKVHNRTTAAGDELSHQFPVALSCLLLLFSCF
jgi:hypothetical protein